MANSRGNRYSKRHVSIKPTDPQFWKWSWQEIAKYDVPGKARFKFLNFVSIQILLLYFKRKKAIIDAVLECSGQRNVYYIGHSQGTLVMFAHLSECYPEEARKIRCFFALGTC